MQLQICNCSPNHTAQISVNDFNNIHYSYRAVDNLFAIVNSLGKGALMAKID